jgi:hypothetical protein
LIGKKSPAALFSGHQLRFRRQKTRFLPPASARGYARTRGAFFGTAAASPAAKNVVFAAGFSA